MTTLQEKATVLQEKLEANLNKLQQIQEEIKTKQAEASALTQPILEDQGALKVIRELIDDTLDSTTEP